MADCNRAGLWQTNRVGLWQTVTGLGYGRLYPGWAMADCTRVTGSTVSRYLPIQCFVYPVPWNWLVEGDTELHRPQYFYVN